MNMMKNIFNTIICLMIIQTGLAQVPKTTVVEHFTNSNCSVCASNNPGIFATLRNYPDAIHVAFYPSSPYAACIFSQQNTAENDLRTYLYNVYGGTPRLVVNGIVISNTALGSALNTASTHTTEFTVKATENMLSSDSIKVDVVITKVAANTATSALLFTGVVEDTISVLTANGEPRHYNVFRKALTSAAGNTVTLPVNINDSVTFNFKYKIKNGWNSARLSSVAILQNNATKATYNAAKSTRLSGGATGIISANGTTINLYPNPANTLLYTDELKDYERLELLDITGKVVLSHTLPSASVDVSSLPAGLFIARVNGKTGTHSQRLIIQH